MSLNKKYFYLKLKDSFFDRKEKVMSTESLNSHLIKNPDLLQSLVSGVVTCKNERNHTLNGVFSRLLWFFRVVGWRTGIQYLQGKYRRPYSFEVTNHLTYFGK